MSALVGNWRQKSLENLEKQIEKKTSEPTFLVGRCAELRKKPLESFTTEDLRLMISQQFSLKYLIPLAIETLMNDIFAEGDYYEGDLLKAVLEVNDSFWNDNKEYLTQIKNLIDSNILIIEEKGISVSPFYK